MGISVFNPLGLTLATYCSAHSDKEFVIDEKALE